MHIREGEEQMECFSTEKYITCSVRESDGTVTSAIRINTHLTSVSADEYKKVIKINGKDYNLVLSRIIPNATEALKASSCRSSYNFPYLSTGMMERESIVLKKGERKAFAGFNRI